MVFEPQDTTMVAKGKKLLMKGMPWWRRKPKETTPWFAKVWTDEAGTIKSQ